MRHAVWIILLLLPSVCLGYTPPAADLLEKMEDSWQKNKPLDLKTALETPEGKLLRTIQISVPHRPEPESFRRRDALEEGYLPFAYLTSSSQVLNRLLPSLYRKGATVRLARIDEVVCYVLESSTARLWLRKDDLYPLRSEIRMDSGDWVTSRYIDPVPVGGKVSYPDMTEVVRRGDLVLIERLLGQHPGSSAR